MTSRPIPFELTSSFLLSFDAHRPPSSHRQDRLYKLRNQLHQDRSRNQFISAKEHLQSDPRSRMSEEELLRSCSRSLVFQLPFFQLILPGVWIHKGNTSASSFLSINHIHQLHFPLSTQLNQPTQPPSQTNAFHHSSSLRCRRRSSHRSANSWTTR